MSGFRSPETRLESRIDRFQGNSLILSSMDTIHNAIELKMKKIL